MARHVFKMNLSIILSFLFVFCFVFLYAYLYISMPIWVLTAVGGVSSLILLNVFKEKVVIEGQLLRYEKLFDYEEVMLRNVSRIAFQERRTTGLPPPRQYYMIEEQRTVGNVIYIIDYDGHLYFTIPSYVVRQKDRQRFKDAILSANSNIEFY